MTIISTERRPICAAFRSFHADNPHVYAVLVKLTREYLDRTMHAHVGMSLVFGRARWELAIRSDDPQFELNNNHAPFYARLIMAREPDLAEVFETRRSVADATRCRCGDCSPLA